jgi:transposase
LAPVKESDCPKKYSNCSSAPYCPELNPVERIWKYIKDNVIKNKVFEALEILEDEVCEFVKNLTSDIVMGVCG